MSLPHRANSRQGPRILVVRLGAMGDVIQTLPAVADLRRALPDAKIIWAVDKRWQELLVGNPDIDGFAGDSLRGALAPKAGSIAALRDLLADLRGHQFDLALDMQGLIKSALVASASGATVRAGLEHYLLREPHAAMLYQRRLASSSAHVVDRYRDLARWATGAVPERARFPLPAGEVRDGLPERFVLASPQAGWGAKQWPPERYSDLAARLWAERGIPLVADCSPAQETYANSIRDAAPAGAAITHPSTLSQLIGATRRASAVVGVDSGPLHLAAALERPGVAIFGPTDPARNGPYGSTIKVLRAPDAANSYKRTAEPSPAMRAWSADEVYAALAPLLD